MKHTLVFLLCLLLLAGCQSEAPPPPQEPVPEETLSPEITAPPDTETESPEEQQPDLKAIGANEAGKVMVLMYHEIGGEEATWRRSTDNFRQDLQTLYEKGYRPVSLNDFLRGDINIPAGTSPVVLTFDDGTAGQFRLLEEDDNLIIDPDCAVAILQEMAAAHADFNPAATFFIYYPVPFRQRDYIEKKLKLLHSYGFEIGNHAYNHENLAKVSPEEAVRSLAMHVRETQSILPGYQVTTLALPYGALPADDSHIVSGAWEGTGYTHEALLLVGANPALSPFDTRFNPLRLPRVRADGTEMHRWLNYFDSNPGERYISDGDERHVTVPEELAGRIDPESLGGRTLL
ncbi:MAG TPA: polysaccharide deacetylase family protein, partial [Firmicutes bacterium]|nr:polysaccharide deacetylase family protein [Bacillota bacterium]